MDDNDTFRLLSPDQAVVLGVALAIGVCVGLSLDLSGETKYLEKCRAAHEQADHTTKVLTAALNGAVITIDNEPAVSCRVIRRRKS